jgi:hypothetical protein
LTNSFSYVNLDWSTERIMFNIGLKKEVKRKKRIGSEELMNSQVRKVLEQKGQGLILMARG